MLLRKLQAARRHDEKNHEMSEGMSENKVRTCVCVVKKQKRPERNGKVKVRTKNDGWGMSCHTGAGKVRGFFFPRTESQAEDGLGGGWEAMHLGIWVALR